MIPAHVWADDLTGAAEAAAALAARSGRTVALALADDGGADAELVVRDLDLRHSTDHEAREELRARLAPVPATERVFLKLDSQLHGPVAGMLAGTLDGGRSVLLSAANPALGRVTIDGVHQVPGPAGVITTRLADLLADVPHRPLDSAAPVGHDPQVLIADVHDQGDLDTLARTAVGQGLDVAGAAAMLEALLAPQSAAAASPVPPVRGQLVAVIGSTEEVAHAQLDAAAAHEAVDVVEAHPRQPAEALEAAAAALAAGRHLALMRTTGADGLPTLADVAANVLATCDPRATATLLTGGHTARLVLDRLGIATLTVVPQPLGAVVRLHAPSGLTVFTKPGSYGSADAVVGLLDTLRPITQEHR